MIKFSFLFLLAISSSAVFAAREHFDYFAKSLEKYYGFDTFHLLEVADTVRVAKPSLLARWGVVGATAEASYNHFLNTIVLKEKNFVLERGLDRVIGYDDLKGQERYSFTSKAQTIFHELMHGDYDVFIENSDEPVSRYLSKQLPKRMKSQFSWKGKAVAHELIGYTAGQIIEILDTKIMNILMQYGIHFHQDRCFERSVLEKIAKRLDLSSDLSFKSQEDKSYWNEMIATIIFVRGKDFQPNLSIEDKINLKAYFKEKYKMPTHSTELLKFMNNSIYREKLEQCYHFLK